ncbi:DNA cytosine methyltransferase [Comamonas terrigena]|uniref:DNA cytosine methyltransferase n=1 Tax=Comamonas terrigena TaxID=32013 RepID=UPI0028A18328|nr:DNA cytosine methyltransferase [Comamonas terrigena]
MANYYNEINKYAAGWLRNLIAAGHIAPGVVDERSIEDVHPDDLRGFTQCHFFAGIGVWSYALRRAGWPDDRPVWTGSCPCQPFSSAGEGAGFDDERHLWPAFFHLIQQRRPATVFGEQVASRDANPWIDLVQDDLEGVGYGVGAVPFPSAGVGAPHIRDRLYWMAHAHSSAGRKGRSHIRGWPDGGHAQPRTGSGGSGMPLWLGNPTGTGPQGRQSSGQRADTQREAAERDGQACGMADVHQHRRPALSIDRGHDTQHHAEPCGESGGLDHPERIRLDSKRDGDNSGDDRQFFGSAMQRSTRPGPVNGIWSAADWLLCRDGKWRPVEPGTSPLAHGATARVGRLCAYGNAINAEAACVFIQAAMSSLETE